MTKVLDISLDDLRSFNPCSASWKYATRMFQDVASLRQMLDKLISERGDDKASQVMPVDWGFWAMRLWMDDPEIGANIRGLAKHILNYTAQFTDHLDEHCAVAKALAIRLLDNAATDGDLERQVALKLAYELDARRPPVYYALGSDIGVDISNVALSVLPYTGSRREEVIRYFEDLLLAFSDHDHTYPFTFGEKYGNA